MPPRNSSAGASRVPRALAEQRAPGRRRVVRRVVRELDEARSVDRRPRRCRDRASGRPPSCSSVQSASKASSRPSGDHDGCPAPTAVTIRRPALAQRCDVHAVAARERDHAAVGRPLGIVQVGRRSPAGVGTSVRTAPPAASVARMPPELGAGETNASDRAVRRPRRRASRACPIASGCEVRPVGVHGVQAARACRSSRARRRSSCRPATTPRRCRRCPTPWRVTAVE